MPIMCAILSTHRFKLKSLIDFGGKYFYHDNCDDTTYNRVFLKHMDTTMKRFIIKMLTISVSFLFGGFGALYTYFMYGNIPALLEVQIPFCEPNSSVEYILQFIYQAILVLMDCCCT